MIVPAQIPNPYVKPKWQASVGIMESVVAYNCRQASVGIMESVVAYNCRKYGFPRPVLATPMWEGAGNRAIDLSGRGNHNTLTGSPSWAIDGLDLNGISDYTVGDRSNLYSFQQFTISCRVNLATLSQNSSYPGLMSYECANSDYGWILLYENSGDRFQFYCGETPWNFTETEAVAADRWYTVTAVRDSTNLKIYLDGVWIADTTIAGQMEYQEETFLQYLGMYLISSKMYLEAIIDVPFIFDVPLTSAQIKFLHYNPYFMYRMPEELYGYSPAAVGAIMNQFQKANVGADLYNGGIIA